MQNSSPKLEAVTRMLNAFPPTTDDFNLLLDTYEQQLAAVSTEAVERSVRRFLAGEVDGQSKKFAPTIPEFMEEARDSQRYVDLLNQPRVAGRAAAVVRPRPPSAKADDFQDHALAARHHRRQLELSQLDSA